jgi:trehalose-6-phosphate synthase
VWSPVPIVAARTYQKEECTLRRVKERRLDLVGFQSLYHCANFSATPAAYLTVSTDLDKRFEGQTSCNKNMTTNLGIMISSGPSNSRRTDDLVTISQEKKQMQRSAQGGR